MILSVFSPSDCMNNQIVLNAATGEDVTNDDSLWWEKQCQTTLGQELDQARHQIAQAADQIACREQELHVERALTQAKQEQLTQAGYQIASKEQELARVKLVSQTLEQFQGSELKRSCDKVVSMQEQLACAQSQQAHSKKQLVIEQQTQAQLAIEQQKQLKEAQSVAKKQMKEPDNEIKTRVQEYQELKNKHERVEKSYTEKLSLQEEENARKIKQLNGELSEQSKKLEQQRYNSQSHINECLPYAFGLVITEGINPLLSWFNKRQFENKNFITKAMLEKIKKDAKKAQKITQKN